MFPNLNTIPLDPALVPTHVELSVPRASSLPYQRASTGQRLTFQLG